MMVQTDLDPRLPSKGYVGLGDDIELIVPNFSEPEKKITNW